jgi:hypothetical protein
MGVERGGDWGGGAIAWAVLTLESRRNLKLE